MLEVFRSEAVSERLMVTLTALLIGHKPNKGEIGQTRNQIDPHSECEVAR